MKLSPAGGYNDMGMPRADMLATYGHLLRCSWPTCTCSAGSPPSIRLPAARCGCCYTFPNFCCDFLLSPLQRAIAASASASAAMWCW